MCACVIFVRAHTVALQMGFADYANHCIAAQSPMYAHVTSNGPMHPARTSKMRQQNLGGRNQLQQK